MPGRCKGFAAPLVVLALGLPVHVLAGPYEDGESAYRRKDYAAAMKRWHPLAEGDDARAQAGIAALYHGGLGVARDYGLAAHWCEKAAKQGEAKALYLLASMYRDGAGVKRDLARAIALYRDAADQDLHWAQYNLGLMYFLGEGVPSDHSEAYHWFALATAAAGPDNAQVSATASYMLDKVSAKLTPDQVKQAKQRVSEWKPVAQASRDK
jgi:uncharacterized protein